jgi:hypothetical protein
MQVELQLIFGQSIGRRINLRHPGWLRFRFRQEDFFFERFLVQGGAARDALQFKGDLIMHSTHEWKAGLKAHEAVLDPV